MKQTHRELRLHYQSVPTQELAPDDKALVEAALEVAQKAYAPYSHFHVGAALRLEGGTIVTGSNQENAAYPSGTCAERTALFYAGAQYPNDAPLTLAIVAINQEGRVPHISPCGACRQVILETATRYNRPYRVILSGRDESIILDDCRALLPWGFDGSEL